MREITATISSKGQVTVPVEVRRQLGVGPHDKLSFIIDEAGVHMRPPRFSLESVFGSMDPLSGTTTEDFEQQIEEAMEDHADSVVRKLQRS